MPYDHEIPSWCHHIERKYASTRVKDTRGLVNGSPGYSHRTPYTTKIYPTATPKCMLPVIRIVKTQNEAGAVTIHLPFLYKRPAPLTGQRLHDTFENTPKLHCAADFDDYDGTFDICIALDAAEVYTSLRGSVDRERHQKYVQVRGRIRDYAELCRSSVDITCTCLLAPDLPRKREGFWCKSGCSVIVQERLYVNCNELQIWEELIDFEHHGLNVFDFTSDRYTGISVLERPIPISSSNKPNIDGKPIGEEYSESAWGVSGAVGWGDMSPMEDGGGWGDGLASGSVPSNE